MIRSDVRSPASMRARRHAPRAALLALLALACACGGRAAGEPRHFLAITHSALNRVTFFDLDAHRVVGALPAQKLPHDLLLAPDQRTLDVVCSGAQCVMAYHLDSPELWRRARAFMQHDTARAVAHGATMAHEEAPAPGPDVVHRRPLPIAGATPLVLNPDPVQALPASVAETHLTDPAFPTAPDSVVAAHERVRAREHVTCFDCHEHSHGGKPFGPVLTQDGRTIELVHLAYRNIVELDAATFAVRRTIPLDVAPEYAPVELWHRPGTDTALVTCRYLIGQAHAGVILVVDLRTGRTVRTIPAGIYPWHVLPSPDGRHVLVNNFHSSRISVLDLARLAIVDSLVVQNGPVAMSFAPGGRELVVTCFYTQRVVVVNLATKRIENEIPVGSNPTSLLWDANGTALLVLCGGESDIESIDWRSRAVVARWPVLFGAYAFQLVDLDHSGRWVGATGPR